jgi:hypothetical protein
MPEGPAPILLNDDLIDGYTAACAVGFGENPEPNSEDWLVQKRGYLRWWRDQLIGMDLRTQARPTILSKLVTTANGAEVRVKSRAKKIETIKHLYSWLCDDSNGKSRMNARDNPAATIRMPKPKPAQLFKNKAASPDDIKRVWDALSKPTGGRFRTYAEGFDHWRQDAIIVLSECGWHYSELRRFAVTGGMICQRAGRAMARSS